VLSSHLAVRDGKTARSIDAALSRSAMLVETSRTQRRYDRIASLYDVALWPMERLLHRRLRERLFAAVPAGARMLEVGAGTGSNLDFFPEDVDAVVTDLSPRMLARAEARARRLGRAATLAVADAQQLPFDDASFDAVVASFVFCSVPDPLLGFREAARVCRPGGVVSLLEHVRPTGTLAGALADLVDPAVHRLWGAHVNRRTVETVLESGLHVSSVETSFAIFRNIVAKKER